MDKDTVPRDGFAVARSDNRPSRLTVKLPPGLVEVLPELADSGRGAYPAVLARCGVLRVKDGRKVVGGQNGRDVLSPYCQRRKNIAVERLDRFDKESGEWIEAIVEDARTPVPDQVAFRIDFPAWLCLQTKRNRRIAEALAVGHTNGQVARRFKLSPARISQLRQDFHQSWQEFYGETAAVTA